MTCLESVVMAGKGREVESSETSSFEPRADTLVRKHGGLGSPDGGGRL